MRLAYSVALWRTLAFAACGLAALAVAAALVLTVPLGARGPAPRPTVAVLVDEARQPVWLALANPAGPPLELRALRALTPPPGRTFVLWLIAEPGAPAHRLAAVPSAGLVLDPPPMLLHAGASLAISVEPTGDAETPSAPLVELGTLVATDGLPALPISASPR